MLVCKKISFLFSTLLCTLPLLGRTTIVEFKGAYFLPTDKTFKHIYHKGGVLQMALSLPCSSSMKKAGMHLGA